MEPAQLRAFAERYTTAWCSQNAASVAAHFEPGGSLKVNDGAAAVGREAITAVAKTFMTAFPDLVVVMDELAIEGERTKYYWTLTGTYAETGRSVCISGLEDWRLGPDGLIVESLGHFDAEEYRRQTEG